MSYVCIRLQWLEKPALRESLALIWIGSDSWKELSMSTVGVLGKVVYLCFPWQQHFVCWVYRGGTEPYTNINDQAGRTVRHISAGTESWNIVLAKMGQKMFLFRCLLGERLPWLNPKSLFCSNCKYTSTWTQLGKEEIIFSLTGNKKENVKNKNPINKTVHSVCEL